MILRLLLAPITAPIDGLTWIAEKIQERVDAELDDKENLQKRLLALQLAYDMGELSEDEFEAQEEELLLAIQELEDRRRQAEEDDL
ncbi:MAG: gas vesicle protein GvpG [Cyanobacteria bacterium]|nr:gas vesicle protein GvpG [Cyanobacteriota bacterium]MDW8199789.1 gas vesicle protein GvpG [Cyanobacteriota bacterium SKYGB_h_bin112]